LSSPPSSLPAPESSDDDPPKIIVAVSWQQARVAVASLDSNPTMSAIRATIELTGLPVSPGTGGRVRRTKTHIVSEMRSLVGLSPLPAPVEMGIPVEAATPPPPTPPPPPSHHGGDDAGPVPIPASQSTRLAAERTGLSALGTRIARARSARRAWPRVADALRAKRGGLIVSKLAMAPMAAAVAPMPPPHRGLRGTLFCFTFVNLAAMAAMAMAYTFAPSTSSSVTIFDDGGGASPSDPTTIIQLALPFMCLIALPALAACCDFSRLYLPICKQAKGLLGGVLGRHLYGRPPPLGDTSPHQSGSGLRPLIRHVP
jgi:hypothetical protein